LRLETGKLLLYNSIETLPNERIFVPYSNLKPLVSNLLNFPIISPSINSSSRLKYRNLKNENKLTMSIIPMLRRSKLLNLNNELLKNREKQVQTSTKLAQEIAAATSIESIYELVVNLTKKYFGYYHVNFYKLEGEVLITQEATGKEGMAMKNEPRTIPLDAKRSIVAFAARSRKSVLVEDVLNSNIWLYNPYLPKSRSEIAVPIKLKSEVIGVLDVQSDKIRGLNKEDELLLLGLAGQVAIAIDYEKTKFELNQHKLNLESLVKERTSELLKANAKLLKAKKVSEKLLKIKEEFVANITHELRTPLNTVIGFSNLIYKTKLTFDQKKYVDIIQIAADNLIVIIDDILNLVQLETGHIKVANRTVNFRSFFQNFYKIYADKANDKGLFFDIHIASNTPSYLQMDQVRMSQILTNLINNAFKFTSKGNITLNVKLVKKQKDEAHIKFEVKDTGIGIAQNKIKLIFQTFSQASNNISKKYGGTGLGLTIVKKLVETLGGEIYVESKLGKGSTFSFILPMKISQKNINKPEYINTDKKRKPFKDYKILLVEDNKLNQLVAREFLEDWGAMVILADNGEFALAELEKERKFNLILMDLRMPDMDGFETLKEIKKRKLDNIPVLALTASTVSEELKKAMKLGVKDYVIKPFHPLQLQNKIKEYAIKN
jgi:signal transduction histidine kinase/CheY-like chemotaxis protein